MSSNGNSGTTHEGLARFCHLVEDKLGWGDCARWRNQDFGVLSQKIFEVTNVSLSITTLKRVFGKVRYDSLPNATTLNALAAFIGYENWLEFETKDLGRKKPEESGTTVVMDMKRATSGRVQIVYLLILALLTGGVLGFVFIRNGHPSEQKPKVNLNAIDQVVFASSPVAKGIPNTVVFRFDIAGLSPQRVEIQQSWDETKRFDVEPDAKEATSTYYYPGYFRAKLLLDGHIVKEHDLFIRSDGWIVTLNSEPQPRYFQQHELANAGMLAVHPDVLEEAQSKHAIPLTLGFHYVDDFGNVSADDFILEARIQNTYAGGDAICQVTRIVILGTEGFAIIPFSIPGCVGDLRIVVHKTIQEGKAHDLSAFGCDFSQMQHVVFHTRDGRASISLNDNIIHEMEYSDDIGGLAGFRFLFSGGGIVDDVVIKDHKGKVVLAGGF